MLTTIKSLPDRWRCFACFKRFDNIVDATNHAETKNHKVRIIDGEWIKARSEYIGGRYH